ncbi:anti-sigma factor [Bacteroides thetaiotaomicron]|uniref:hypothetical protein n=1 Tax=Bacteroides thetaiotaomicron TaxID=818 RepID=UPI0006C70D68|nr:hypothetical protein [Bacteroides thetaiotaomicron]CUN21648.1 anti-sigma factor [Bacteroides thetaiotaomicron]
MKNYFQKIITLFTGNDYPESTQQDFYKWLVDEEHTSEKDEALQKLWDVNPEKRNVPLYKNDAFQKVQKRRVQKSGEPGPSLHDQSPPLFSHLNTI